MKLYTTDNSELMDIATIKAEDGGIVVTGMIMGAVPVKAVVKPEEMRAALRQMSLGTMFRAALMVVQGAALWAIGAGLLAVAAAIWLTRG